MSTINSRFNVKIELFRASIRRVHRSPENDPRHAMTFQLYRIHAHTLLHLYISTPYIHTTYSHIDRRTILSLRDRSRYEVARSQSLISLLFSLSISPSPLSVSRLSVSLYIRIYHSFSFSLSFSRYILSLSLLLCLSTSRSVSLRRSGLLRTAPCYLVDSFAFTARNLCEVFERSIILILSFPLSLSHRINLILPRCERSVFQLPISIFLRSRAAATFFFISRTRCRRNRVEFLRFRFEARVSRETRLLRFGFAREKKQATAHFQGNANGTWFDHRIVRASNGVKFYLRSEFDRSIHFARC